MQERSRRKTTEIDVVAGEEEKQEKEQAYNNTKTETPRNYAEIEQRPREEKINSWNIESKLWSKKDDVQNGKQDIERKWKTTKGEVLEGEENEKEIEKEEDNTDTEII